MGVVYYFVDFISVIIDAVVMERFLYLYLGVKEKSIEIVKWAKWGVYLLLFIESILLDDVIVVQGVVFITILFLYARLFLKGNWKKQLLICCIEFVISLLVAIFVMQFIAVIFRYTQTEILFEAGLPRFISICINKLVFLFVFYLMLTIFGRDYNLNKNEWMLSTIYFISAIIISVLLFIWTAHRNNTFAEQVFASLVTVLLIVTTVVSIYLVTMLSRKNEIDRQNQTLKFLLEKDKTAILNLEKEYSTIKILRHDMNKQLNIYLQLLKKGNVEETIKYLGQQIEINDSTKSVYVKDNNLISAILTEKKEKCDREKIAFEYVIETKICQEQEMDLAIMLSNLLDNAIEAEMKLDHDRSISLEINELKSMYNITVENYIEESVLDKNPELVTDKDNHELHGYGMKSIEATVSKYKGMYERFEDDHSFSVHVMIEHQNVVN